MKLLTTYSDEGVPITQWLQHGEKQKRQTQIQGLPLESLCWQSYIFLSQE